MNYQNTIEWMMSQLPMFQQKGKDAYKGKMDNIINFCNRLGQPQKKYPTVHIAGTNGKGSSSHAIASVLQEAGYKVGLYTSPHLRDFRERIRVNGVEVEKDFVVDFIEKHKPFFQENSLSFFEMTVGLAFEYFAYEKVDIAVVEVGLGGRKDSTNVVEPQVCLITNIGFDHTEILGDTLAKIAYQKAGIIKEGVPVVIGEYDSETAPVFEQVAKEKHAPIIFAHQKEVKYEMELKGNYQKSNIKGIVATIEQLQKKGWKIEEKDIEKGLMKIVENTGLKGRWQRIGENPTIICDTGHNAHGLRIVTEQIRQQKYDRLHIVLGFVKEKKIDDILPLFPKDATYYFCKPQIPRGLDQTILREKAKEMGLDGECYSSVAEALEKAKENAKEKDFIFVGGSTFVVAEVV